MAAFLNLHGKSKPAKITSFYRRAPNAAGGLYLWCQDDMPNTFATCVADHSQVNQYSSWRCEQDPMIGKRYLAKLAFQLTARTYTKTFVEESITKDCLTMIDREVLKELGVTTIGHALAILKLAKKAAMLEGESFDFYISHLSSKLFFNFEPILHTTAIYLTSNRVRMW